MIFRRNNLNIGIGLGILFPMAVFGILLGITQLASIPLKMRTMALIAICTNIFITTQFRKNRAGESMRGSVLATVVLSIVWAIWFGQEIFEELQNT
jgi:hypothetical protein